MAASDTPGATKMTAVAGRPRSFALEGAVEEAMRQFWSVGFDATSMETIARAVGVRVGSLYHAFGSKAALFCAAAARYDALVGGSALDAFRAADGARAAAEAYLRAHVVSFTADGSRRGCLMVLADATCPADEAEARRCIESSARRRLAALVGLFEQAVAAGHELPADPRRTARFVDLVVQGLAVRAHEGASRRELLDSVDLAMAVWPAA